MGTAAMQNMVTGTRTKYARANVLNSSCIIQLFKNFDKMGG